MATPIGLSRVHFPVTALGPGKRVGIWFQGCSIRCPGCISADTWSAPRRLSTVEELLADLASIADEAEGWTISGGEPFDQPAALRPLVQGIRAISSVDILVFSGYPYERVRHVLEPHAVDAIISDPFLLDAPQTLAMRGSDNQRLWLLTDKGRERFAQFERRRGEADRHLDAMFDENGVAWFAGIPDRGDFARLQALLREQGTIIKTSEHKV